RAAPPGARGMEWGGGRAPGPRPPKPPPRGVPLAPRPPPRPVPVGGAARHVPPFPPIRPNGAVVDNDPRELIAVLRQSHDRLASLAGAISEDFLTHISYADAWTVAQVFSHLGSGAEISFMMLEAALCGPPLDPD